MKKSKTEFEFIIGKPSQVKKKSKKEKEVKLSFITTPKNIKIMRGLLTKCLVFTVMHDSLFSEEDKENVERFIELLKV